MTTTITVKNLTFQQGTTRICVPLMGQTLDELKARARALVEVDADIIEWRADGFA
ncbi:3-dehydroquinate dehydratase, partial [Bacillus sp. SRB_28]